MSVGRRVAAAAVPAVFAVAAGWPVAYTGAAAQAPTFSARVETVRLDVAVQQDGRAVRGLTAADFDVLDNGVRQQVTFVGLESTPVNVVLALDMSGSVQGERLRQLQGAGTRLVDLLAPGDTAALVTFSDRAVVASAVTADRAALVSALQRTPAGADTALIDAAHAAMVLSDAAVARPLAIVFSDGVDTASFLSPALVLDTARRIGPVVYAVTSTSMEPGGFLDDLVRLTGGRRLDAGSVDRVSEAFAEILREARERYLISYAPTGVVPGGWHELTVRVRGGRGDVRVRPGYLGAP